MNELAKILLRASVHHFIGRLGGDPEVRFLESGNSVCNARIGINRPGAKQGDGSEADWIKLEIWGEDGQRFADACRKGQEVHVVGRVKSDRWADRKTGKERMQLCCTVKQWQATPAATPAPQSQTQSAPTHQAPLAAASASTAAPSPEPAAQWNGAPLVPDTDDIPF